MVFSPLDLTAIFLGFSALIGWLNLRLLRLPPGVAMLATGLAGTLTLVGLDRLWPGLGRGRGVGAPVL